MTSTAFVPASYTTDFDSFRAYENNVVGPRCDKHYFDGAVGECADCGQLMCTTCTVSVQRLGTLCRECALVRGGIRRKRD
jgi:hypothetical protein